MSENIPKNQTFTLRSEPSHQAVRQRKIIMKLLRLTTGLSGLISVSLFSSSAMASISVGRGEISLDASVIGTYDSNLSGRNGSADDTYGTFAPRISYTRRAGII